jgi:hypothetical protein
MASFCISKVVLNGHKTVPAKSSLVQIVVVLAGAEKWTRADTFAPNATKKSNGLKTK